MTPKIVEQLPGQQVSVICVHSDMKDVGTASLKERVILRLHHDRLPHILGPVWTNIEGSRSLHYLGITL